MWGPLGAQQGEIPKEGVRRWNVVVMARTDGVTGSAPLSTGPLHSDCTPPALPADVPLLAPS